MPTFREQLIIDLDRSRSGAGDVGDDAVTLTSPTCGDQVSVEVEHDGGVIRSLTWCGHGCTVSMASASALAAIVAGMTLDEFAASKAEFGELVRGPSLPDDELDDHPLGDAVAFAGIGHLPLRAGCATLAWEATAEALIR